MIINGKGFAVKPLSSKQAEVEYPLQVGREHLEAKPFGFAPQATARFLRDVADIIEVIGRAADGTFRVLEAGAGPGWIGRMLAQHGFRVVSADISPTMVEIAAEQARHTGLPAVECVLWDWDEPRFSEEFDVVLLYDALHHAPETAAPLRSSYKALKPGGRIVLFEPTFLHLFSPSARHANKHYGVTEKGFTVHGLRSELKRCGFVNPRRVYPSMPLHTQRFRGLLAHLVRATFSYLFVYPQQKLLVVAEKPVD